MGHGFWSKLLRVDLTGGKIWEEEISEATYRLYPGGKALAVYLLLQNLSQAADPLGPQNVLVLAEGLLTGAPISTATRFTAAARSPLTGGYGESEAGGFWGAELKMAGWDAIVVTGQSPRPVYLWVADDAAEIRDGAHLWRRDPEEVQAAVRDEVGDKLARVLQIGLGGENRVRFAAITHDLRHFNGRTGMGAVMGSKNLKAIAVRGSHEYLDRTHDPQILSELGRKLAKQVKEHPQSWELRSKGTPGLTRGLNAGGILPTRNFRSGGFEGAEDLTWEAYEREIFTARRSCYACAVRCKREVRVTDRYQVSESWGGPEYETVAGFGSDCGINDLQAIAKANELCGRYTLDTISTSSTVAFAMECYEHGLIGPEDTGGLELCFGSADAMVQAVEMIARRKHIGDLLAEGTRRAAEAIQQSRAARGGEDAARFAMHVKGLDLPMHEPRGKVGVGIGYAVNEAGADHLVAYHDTALANPESVSFKGALALGITEALPVRELSRKKAANYAVLEGWSSAGKAIGMCYFGPAPRSFIQAEDVLTAVRAMTGWDVTIRELLRVGERATNLARIFNIREGFSRKDDTLPDRLFQPLEGGALAGVGISREEFEQTLTDLYEIKGWDPVTSAPTRQRLRELDIEWAADLIEAGS
jgi:aldehyde:ferredoxin oxidoreductase